MLNGVGSEKGKTKKIKSNQQKKKNNFAPVAHFFVHCCRNVKFTSYSFYGENVVCLAKNFFACAPVRFFFLTAAHFHLAGH